VSAFATAQWAYDRMLPPEDRPLCDDCGHEADEHPYPNDDDQTPLCAGCRKARDEGGGEE